MKAIWNNTLLAESEDTVIVEGNHYFPVESIRMAYFQPNDEHTVCPWKGTAGYYDVSIDGSTNKSAAWFYLETKQAAKVIKGRVAFWKGVQVIP